MNTQEYAKNPTAEVKALCPSCRKEWKLNEFFKEVPLETPYNTTVAGIQLCPNCGYTKHSYYLTEELRFEQTKLKEAVNKWMAQKSPMAFRIYQNRQKMFKKHFDECQAKYRALFQKEASHEQSEV